MTLPTGSGERKALPVFSGVVAYFPDAVAACAELSRLGNEKHNPGEPLHWSREKSADHPDCILRHMIDMGPDWTQCDPEDGVLHAVKVFWRAGALAQLAVERAKSLRGTDETAV